MWHSGVSSGPEKDPTGFDPWHEPAFLSFLALFGSLVAGIGSFGLSRTCNL